MAVAIMSKPELPKFCNTKREKRHFHDAWKPLKFEAMGKILYLLGMFFHIDET